MDKPVVWLLGYKLTPTLKKKKFDTCCIWHMLNNKYHFILDTVSLDQRRIESSVTIIFTHK